MKKIVLLVLTLTLLAGCQNSAAEPTKPVIQPTWLENVTIQISDITTTGATILITDKNPEPYVYGEWYKIQKKTDTGWVDLTPVIDNYGFVEIGYLPNDNGEVKFTINWQWHYGELPAGIYRIFKQVNLQEIAIEFVI